MFGRRFRLRDRTMLSPIMPRTLERYQRTYWQRYEKQPRPHGTEATDTKNRYTDVDPSEGHGTCTPIERDLARTDQSERRPQPAPRHTTIENVEGRED